MSQEAPNLSEQGKVEDIKAQALALQERLKAAQKDREELLNQKIKDREILIGHSKQMYSDLAEAEKLLVDTQAAMDSTTNAGIEISEVDRKSFETMSNLVDGLRQQTDEVEKQITALSYQPEVMGRIEGEALDENTRKEVEKIRNDAVADLKVEMAGFPQMLQNVKQQYEEEKERLDQFGKESSSAQEDASRIMDEIHGMNTEYYEKIQREKLSPAELRAYFEHERGKLGMFASKQKKQMDFILENLELISGQAREMGEQYRLAHHNLHWAGKWKGWQDVEAKMYAWIDKANAVEDKIDGITGTKGSRWDSKVRKVVFNGLEQALKSENLQDAQIGRWMKEGVLRKQYEY